MSKKPHTAEIVVREAISSKFAKMQSEGQMSAMRRDIDQTKEMVENIATCVAEMVGIIRQRPFGLDQEIIEKLRTVLANRDHTERSILEASVRIQDAANRVANYPTQSDTSQAAQLMIELQKVLAAQRKVLDDAIATRQNGAEPMTRP